MKTKTMGIAFISVMLTLSGTALGRMQSSQFIADNDKNSSNYGQMKKQSRLQDQSCFSDNSCLQERKQEQDQAHLLERDMDRAQIALQSYLRANLTDTERNYVNTQLGVFRNDLDTLNNDYKTALQAGSDLQPIRDRISSLYTTYVGIFTPYIDPSKINAFRTALQTIITNRTDIWQINESKRVLSDQDEGKIDQFIAGVPPFRRLDYLTRVLSRVNNLIQNIGNSNMDSVRKEWFLALLDDILILVQARIDGITNGWNDITPPLILNTSVLWVTLNSATLRTTVNENGTGYYVILPSGSTAPSAVQVQAGQDSASQNVSLKGSGLLVSWVNQIALTGLSANTAYTIYFTALDMSHNLQSTVQGVSFSTLLIDTIPPVISPLGIGNINSTGARLSVTSNEVGTGYYVILMSGSTMPTSLQIQSGQDSASQNVSLKGSGMIVNGTVWFPLGNLASNTAYMLYFTAKDTSGNMLVTPMNISFMTLALPDIIPPAISNLSVTNTTSTGTTLLVTVNESGSGYYVVLPSNSFIPNALQVQAGEDGAGQVTSIHGSRQTLAGVNQFSIGGLSPNTGYVLYFTALDTSGNLQSNVPSILVITSGQ